MEFREKSKLTKNSILTEKGENAPSTIDIDTFCDAEADISYTTQNSILKGKRTNEYNMSNNEYKIQSTTGSDTFGETEVDNSTGILLRDSINVLMDTRRAEHFKWSYGFRSNFYNRS